LDSWILFKDADVVRSCDTRAVIAIYSLQRPEQFVKIRLLRFLKLIPLKKWASGVSFRFPMALAAFRKAILSRLLPLETL
jgi:hypothetical protein